MKSDGSSPQWYKWPMETWKHHIFTKIYYPFTFALMAEIPQQIFWALVVALKLILCWSNSWYVFKKWKDEDLVAINRNLLSLHLHIHILSHRLVSQTPPVPSEDVPPLTLPAPNVGRISWVVGMAPTVGKPISNMLDIPPPPRMSINTRMTSYF